MIESLIWGEENNQEQAGLKNNQTKFLKMKKFKEITAENFSESRRYMIP